MNVLCLCVRVNSDAPNLHMAISLFERFGVCAITLPALLFLLSQFLKYILVLHIDAIAS